MKKKLEKGLEVKGPIFHIFSHRRWEMYWVDLEWPDEISDIGLCWVSREELKRMALPVAFQKLLEEPNRNYEG